MGENEESKKYDAFISYRHSELDMYVAKTLEKKLENYKIPKSLYGKANRKKISRIFRDQDELPIASDLSEQIEAALQVTDYLIVICTPRLPESTWCRNEITTFSKLQGKSKILAVLAEGEPSDSFPEELLVNEVEVVDENGEKRIEEIRVEPLAADVRGNSKKEINKKIDDAVMRLVAAICGIEYDDLKQRHREREMKRRMARLSIAASIFLIFAMVSTVFMINIAGKNQEITTQNNLIASQKEEIEIQKKELEEQYKETQKNYIDSMSRTAETLLGEGKRKEAIYALLSVIPEHQDDELYSAEAHRVLNKCMNTNYTNGDYLITGEVDVEGNMEDLKVSDDGNYAIVRDATNLILIETETAKEIERLPYSTVYYNGIAWFIDNNHFVYQNEENGYNLYTISERKSERFCLDYASDIEKGPSGETYCVYSTTKVSIFKEGEYEPYKQYDYLESFEAKAVDKCFYYNEDTLAIISGNYGKCTITYLDITTDEIVGKAEFDSPYRVRDYLMINQSLFMMSSKTSYVSIFNTRSTDTIIYKVSKLGEKVESKNFYGYPCDSISIDNKLQIVLYDNYGMAYLNFDTLEDEYGEIFEYGNEENTVISADMGKNSSCVQLIRKDGSVSGFFEGYELSLSHFSKKYEKGIRQSIGSNEVWAQTLEGDNNVIILRRMNRKVYYDSYKYTSIISKDGKRVIVLARVDSLVTCILIDVTTGQEITSISPVTYCAFTQYGKTFVVQRENNTIEIYSSEDGSYIRTIDVGDLEKVSVNESSDRYVILNNAGDDKIASIENGKIIGEIVKSDYIEGAKNYAISNKAEKLAIYSDKINEIYLYNRTNIDDVIKTEVETRSIGDICFSSDDKYLVICYNDQKIEIYSVTDLSLIATVYDVEISFMEMTYISEYDKYLLFGDNGSVLLNADFRVEDRSNSVHGYGKDTGFLVSTEYTTCIVPYVEYDDLYKEAKEYLGDFEPSEEIKQKYNLGD